MFTGLECVELEPQLYSAAPSLQMIEAADVEEPLPCIPALIATRLQLQRLLEETAIDLRAVSEVILSDPGATLQVLRLAGEEFSDEEGRPTLIHDCIASMDAHRCYDAICSSLPLLDAATVELWQHSRRVAECASDLAKLIDGVSPSQAYVVGLLNGIGKIPELLGWTDRTVSPGERAAIGVQLARQWQLPLYLQRAMEEQQKLIGRSCWGEILEVAELLAASPTPSPLHRA